MTLNTIQLGDICEFTYGESLKEEKRLSGKVPVYGSNGRVGWHNHAITSGPTIVIGRKGSIGEVNWSRESCYPIDTTYYIEKTKKPCDLRWLYYTLLKLNLSRLNKSAAVPGLNRDDAYEQLIPFPDLFLQRRIAQQLDQANQLRCLRLYALELNSAFAKSVWAELFCSSVKVAKQFPLDKIGKLVNFIDYRGISPNKQPSGVRLITARNVKRGYFEVNPEEFIPENEYESWMRRGIPRPGDVLFTTEGHTLGSAAKLPPFRKIALAQRLIALQPGPKVNSDYLLYLILTSNFQGEVVRRSTGSAARGITSKQLAEIPIPVPPMLLQQKFATIVKRHEYLRSIEQESLRQSEHLFQSLLHQAFNEN